MSADTQSWTTFSLTEKTVYFIFGDDPKTELPDVIQTADTEKFIDLSLFDYVVGSAPGYSEYNQFANQWAGDTTGINKDHALKFQTNAGGRNENSINASKSPNPNTEIIKPLLQKDPKNGNDLNLYPVLNDNKYENSSESLAYLFNSVPIDNVKSVHEDLNYLFTYTDSTREYSFNSDLNYAYLDTENESNNFIVYSEPATIHSGTWGTDNYKESHGFFPFSKYEAVDGTERKWQTGVDLDCNEKQNHYFGMSMRTNFMQPKGGQIAENTDMIFSFSGDDDVWVFIDDVLVMDIGGSHTAVSGTINFRTGKVTVGNSTAYIGDLLLESNPELEDKVYRNNLEGDQKISTLKDYETYSLDFFYLERGNYDSNCSLKFNLAMIEKNSVSVGKEITDVDTSKYGDIEFEYLIEVGDSEETLVPYTNKKYKIYNLDDRTYTGKTGTTDGAGKFKLKHNELAVFEEDTATGTDGIDENLYYKVTELNLNSHEYNEVKINSTEIVSEDREENVSQDGVITGNATNQQYDAPSPVYQVADTNSVIFRNRCSAYNQRELHIKKEMKTGQTSSQKFDMQVTLNGTLYSGSYILISSDGTKQKLTTSNGIIQLGVDEEAVISDIPAEMSFEVVEQTESLPTEYKIPQYKVTNGGDNPITEQKASGCIVSGKDAEVVITNSYTAPDALFIEIQKTFSGLEQLTEDQMNALQQAFEIQVYDSTGNTALWTLKLNDSNCLKTENTYSWKIEIPSTGINTGDLVYQIQENGAIISGYELTVTVNGVEIPVSEKSSVSVTNPTFAVLDNKFKEVNYCSTLNFDFETNFIAARIERNAEQNYFVWTKDELSITEREALVALVILKAGNDWNDMTTFSTLFYSDNGDNSIKSGIEVAGNVVKMDENNTLTFSATNQWQKVCGGFYEKTSGQNAEIEITNSYIPEKVTIDLQKYGTNYQVQQNGAKFSLYSGTLNSTGDRIDWSTVPVAGYENFDVTDSKMDELQIPSGYYKLVEIKAPSGFQLLDEDICFKVENNTVKLVNAQGEVIADKQSMWELSTNGTIVIKIQNTALYDLPSAGGSGIFWYLISGTAFLMAASLILYRMKRKEVLGK